VSTEFEASREHPENMEHRNQQEFRRDCELSLQCSWCCKGTGQQEMCVKG
jgi:hypothetical protein